MPRVTPKSREELSDLEDVFERAEQALGFVPNSFFLMDAVQKCCEPFHDYHEK